MKKNPKSRDDEGKREKKDKSCFGRKSSPLPLRLRFWSVSFLQINEGSRSFLLLFRHFFVVRVSEAT